MLKRIFTWWNGATIGTLFDIGRRGVFVGKDEQGNRYYEEKRPSLEGRKRRYVVYDGLAEASRVSPDWHGWLHYTFDEPPTDKPLKRQSWEKPHIPNLTGTVHAYRPQGSLARGGVRQASSSDYEAWAPDAESTEGRP
ncbi:MAG TPA: NADH:ubiquinone oxidoreductase subunit NDUFA12 [Vitreimonas sp.]|nr:NADH:ubiquinone oxidoreductase subunit NDUFA12 [Vitreimonas sp.]